MQYLITGAAGFIGSFHYYKLAKEGSKIIARDNFSTYYDIGLKDTRVKEILEPLNINVVNLGGSKPLSVNHLLQTVSLI
jgi:UDP-glucuronate 4-epimerase